MLVALRGQMVNLATCRLCRVGDSGQASLFKTLNLGLLIISISVSLCYWQLFTASFTPGESLTWGMFLFNNLFDPLKDNTIIELLWIPLFIFQALDKFFLSCGDQPHHGPVMLAWAAFRYVTIDASQEQVSWKDFHWMIWLRKKIGCRHKLLFVPQSHSGSLRGGKTNFLKNISLTFIWSL